MAVLHYFDWDKYADITQAVADTVLSVNSTPALTASAGPFGGKVLELNSVVQSVAIPFGAGVRIFNAWCRINTGSLASTIKDVLAVTFDVTLVANQTVHAKIECAPGSLRVRQGDGVSVSSGTVPLNGRAHAIFPLQTWFHLEVKFNIANSGNIQIRINGKEVLNVDGDFLNGTSVNWLLLRSGNSNNVRFGPVLIMDDTGSAFNDFIGPVRGVRSLPDGDGAVADWTPLSGANYESIDDALGAADDDATYITSSAVNQVNLAAHATIAPSNVGSIHFVELAALARQETSGDEIALRCVSGGDTADSSDLALGTTYGWKQHFLLNDPDTGAPWDVAAINAAEFGVVLRD